MTKFQSMPVPNATRRGSRTLIQCWKMQFMQNITLHTSEDNLEVFLNRTKHNLPYDSTIGLIFAHDLKTSLS